MAYSGLTGTVPTWNQDTTGNANTASSCTGNASTVTNGVYTNTSQTLTGEKTFTNANFYISQFINSIYSGFRFQNAGSGVNPSFVQSWNLDSSYITNGQLFTIVGKSNTSETITFANEGSLYNQTVAADIYIRLRNGDTNYIIGAYGGTGQLNSGNFKIRNSSAGMDHLEIFPTGVIQLLLGTSLLNKTIKFGIVTAGTHVNKQFLQTENPELVLCDTSSNLKNIIAGECDFRSPIYGIKLNSETSGSRVPIVMGFNPDYSRDESGTMVCFAGSSSSNRRLLLFNQGTGGAWLKLGNSQGIFGISCNNNQFNIYQYGGPGYHLSIDSNGFDFHDNDLFDIGDITCDKLTCDELDVGIGGISALSASPSVEFVGMHIQVNNDTYAVMKLQSQTGNYNLQVKSGEFIILDTVADEDRFKIKSDGAVEIGGYLYAGRGYFTDANMYVAYDGSNTLQLKTYHTATHTYSRIYANQPSGGGREVRLYVMIDGTELGLWRTSGLVIYANLHVTGNITYVGTITDVSDERTKENINNANIDTVYENVKQIQLVNFNHTKTWSEYTNGAYITTPQLGVISQQIEGINSDWVDTTNSFQDDKDNPNPEFDNLKMVKTNQLLYSSIAAIQNLMQKIETLEARVHELENK